jgi:UDP-GlcNAc:undecaprenyl-phosphate GlcNAc-1-phosphate transferase
VPAAAFCLAAWLGLLGNGGLRRVARRAGSGNGPAGWEQDLRRLGGPVLVVGALAGWAFAPGHPGWLVATALAGTAIAVAGLATDRRVLSNRGRQVVVVGGATLVVAAGVRGSVFGSGALDAILTVAWIVLVTNAFARLGHADELATTVALVAAAGVFGVAAGREETVAVVAIALAGSCVGLLVFNIRPASLAAGRAGVGFAGFVLAVLAVEVEPATAV